MGRMSSRIRNSLLYTIPRSPSLFSSSLSSNNLSFRALPTIPSSSRYFFSSSYSSPPVSLFAVFPFNSTFPFFSTPTLRFLNTNSSDDIDGIEDDRHQYETSEGETSDGWEEEEEVEAEMGDGGDGGGVVLQNVPWGERVLSIAREVLLQFGSDMELFAFKTTPRGYIYVRLDKLSHKYGCPSMEEIQSYNEEYKRRLDEIGELGDIPHNLAIEVSSPGGERLLKVPDDLERFKDMPMGVSYVEDVEPKCQEKYGVFLLESIEKESSNCVWKLANVKENRDLLGKGRPLSRKQKDWRLRLPFEMFKRVTLYIEY